METSRMYSAKYVCAELGINRTTLYRWMKAGHVTNNRWPGQGYAHRFTQFDLENILQWKKSLDAKRAQRRKEKSPDGAGL